MSDISYIIASSICMKTLTEYAFAGDKTDPLLEAMKASTLTGALLELVLRSYKGPNRDQFSESD